MTKDEATVLLDEMKASDPAWADGLEIVQNPLFGKQWGIVDTDNNWGEGDMESDAEDFGYDVRCGRLHDGTPYIY